MYTESEFDILVIF